MEPGAPGDLAYFFAELYPSGNGGKKKLWPGFSQIR